MFPRCALLGMLALLAVAGLSWTTVAVPAPAPAPSASTASPPPPGTIPAPAPVAGDNTLTAAAKQVDPGKKIRQQILRHVLLDHFCIGVEAPKSWHDDVRATSGATFDFSVGYLSGGVGKGVPWFFKYGPFLENRLLDCKANNMGAWFTWYMLSQSMPADYKPGPKEATPANAKVASTMCAYFEMFKQILIELNKHPEVPVVMQIEPDEWCHLLISGNMDPTAVDVKVGTCGQLDLVGLPDNEIGWAQAFGRLRDRYAPNVLLSCNPSGWDWQGSMSGERMGTVFRQMCGDEFELATFETADRDKSCDGSNKLPPYGDAVGICGTFSNHLKWIADFHKASDWWVVVWQVASGNTYFDTCNNTPGHRCDNLAQFILENYPKNDGISQYVNAGCCGWMFNAGQGDCTQVWDAKQDGITNPPPIPGSQGHKAQYADDDGGFMRVFGGIYYQHPFAIYGPQKPGSAPKPVTHVEPARVATVTDTAAPARYARLLHQRLVDEVAADRSPSFSFSVIAAKVRIDAIAGDTLTVILADGGQMDIGWASLKTGDLVQLALSQVRQNHPEDRAIAGFYLLLTGDLAKANDQLNQSAGAGRAVRACFTIK